MPLGTERGPVADERLEAIERLLFGFAFFSGLAALVYQVAWSRMLSLSFGSSTLAVSAVVAGFMGGMGVGAWLFHRVGDRRGDPLYSYCLLELAIALSTAALTWIFASLPGFLGSTSLALPTGLALDLVRVAATIVLLVIPAALMGATFPALCRTLMRTSEQANRRVGIVYGLNTVGAAVGALVAGLWTIETLGVRGSITLANAINLAIATAGLAIARHARVAGRIAVPEARAAPIGGPLPIWIAGTALFASGVTSLGYEILWFRALHYLLGPGTYALSATLTVFLLGLGFGALLDRRLARGVGAIRALGLSQLLVAGLALYAIGSIHLAVSTPLAFEALSVYSPAVDRLPWLGRLGLALGMTAVVTLPATLAMGLAFPLATRMMLDRVDRLTERLGLAYFLSSAGSVFGSIFAATWILPSLGTLTGTRCLAVINVLVALLVLSRVPGSTLRRRSFEIALAGALVVVAIGLPGQMGFDPPGPERRPDSEVVLQIESDHGTVQVLRDGTAGPDALAMSIDGAFIAATRAYSRELSEKQALIGHLPMGLDGGIRRTLTLGYASGASVEALARYPWIERLDALEIDRGVVAASRLFPESRVLEDPRARLIVDDAIHFLLRTRKRYDLIVNDAKSHHRSAGTARVQSLELYRYALERLTGCGLFVQFTATHLEPASFRLVVRTFLEVFPETEVFLLPPGLAIFVGSRCAVLGRARPARDQLVAIGVAREIERAFVVDASALPALWVASGERLRRVVGEGEVNEWNRLPLEFRSYRVGTLSPAGWAENLELLVGPKALSEPASLPDGPDRQVIRLVQRATVRLLRGDVRNRRRFLARLNHEIRSHAPDHPVWRAVQGR